MACTITVDTVANPALAGIVKYCGVNCTQLYSYLTTVLEDIEADTLTFKEDFVKEYEKKYNEKPDIKGKKYGVLRDFIIDYYNKNFPNYLAGAPDDIEFDKIHSYGYQSIYARQYAKRVLANKMLEVYYGNEIQGKNKVKQGVKQMYALQAAAAIAATLAARISKITGKDLKEVRKALTEFGSATIVDELMKDVKQEDLSIPLLNLMAMYREIAPAIEVVRVTKDGKTKKEYKVDLTNSFLNETLYDSRLDVIRRDKSEVDSVELQAEQENNSSDPDATDDQVGEESYDTSIRAFSEKLGLVTTFMVHVGASMRLLLGSLKKKVTDNDGAAVLDTDNPLGIADVMDANQCANVLYHYGHFENVKEMMDSIKDIANNLPGFAAFGSLYDSLNANEDLRLEFFRTFRKVVIGKQETVVKNGESFNRISNQTNRQLALKYRFQNAFLSAALTNNTNVDFQALGIVQELIKDYNPATSSNEEFEDIITKLSELLSKYYGDIDRLSIRNYVTNNSVMVHGTATRNVKSNMSNITTIIENTLKEAAITSENYKHNELEIAVIKEHNRLARKGAKDKDGNRLSVIGYDSVYNKPYLSTDATIIQLSKMLQDYVLLTTPLNSRSILGKQTSDVINNSMLTNIKDMLESSKNKEITKVDANGVVTTEWDETSPIMRFAQHLQRSAQYELSPIILEHKDEKGNTINKGLFRKDENGNFIPTEYALDLLKISLFNGASNLDEGSNMEYKQMSKGDYIGTAWRSFFGDTMGEQQTESNTTASYFMRIPSDAPKNFVITASRYSANGLLKVLNRTEINKARALFINGVRASKISMDELRRGAYLFKNYPIVLHKDGKYKNVSEFVNHLATSVDGTVDISINLDRRKNLKQNQTYRMAFRYAPNTNSKSNENVYVMEGVYDNGTLKNAKFIGFVNDEKDSYIDLKTWTDVQEEIENRLKQGEVLRYKDNDNKIKEINYQYSIQSDHVLFKQLKNVFMQELRDMVTAINVMFETTTLEDGTKIVSVEDGVPVFKKGGIVKSNTDHNGLNPVYHFEDDDTDPSKRVIYKVKDGKIVLTGNVFHSDRFILYDYFRENEEDAIRNFGEEILEQAFDIIEKWDSVEGMMLRFDENNNVVLSKEQEEVIEAKLKEFISSYVQNSRHRLNEVKNFIESATSMTDDNIAEFMINTHLAYVGFNDLFEGDTKFYKNSQTFLKRAKEAQGSGVVYGIVDNTRPWQSTHQKIASPLDTTSVVIDGKRVEMYDGFRAITVYNTIKTDKAMKDRICRYLTDKKIMGNAALSPQRARELMDGYDESVVNDAQSYITFEEWVRRITARGQLPKYKPLIDRILDTSKDLTVNDIEEFVQVQKNFYYDQAYNENTGIISPRQIKNAEFVLVPRFIPKDSELEVIYNMMKALDIDQLNTTETSKASTGYRFELWNKEGQINKSLKDDVDKALRNKAKAEKDQKSLSYKTELMKTCSDPTTNAIEVYSYNYLYTQQETKQHVDDENKAGIQVMKKIIDNIDANSPKELQDAKRDFLNLYTANIEDSYNRLMSRLDIQLDDDGNLQYDENGNIKGLNYDKLFEAIKEELTRLGLDSNMQDYCTKDPLGSGKETIMPNYFTLTSAKFENILQSIFNNNITRQTLPGFHAAQVTGMGFRKFSDTVKRSQTSNILQYHPHIYKHKVTGVEITEYEYNNKISEEEKANYVTDGKSVAPYIEIMLPASAFGFDRSKYAHLSREEQNEEFLRQLRLRGLDTIIGYRIPTEGKQSIAYMKVVDFTDDAQGSTIIVPDAWVAQTGADFDIDSIYGIQPSIRFDKEGRIHKVEFIGNTNGTPEEIAKAKRQLYQRYVFKNLSKGEVDAIFEDSKLTDAMIKDIKRVLKVENGRYDADDLADRIKEMSATIREGLIEDIAEEKGLQTFEEFSRKSLEQLNSRDARNTAIFEAMVRILTHNHSILENLSRSNFDDVSKAMDNSNTGEVAKQRKARSPYNFLDQAEYHTDAISGIKLKAFSVVRDTFCSICNALHANLNNSAQIKVRYTTKYKKKDLIASFGKENVEEVLNEKDEVIGYDVTHTMLGWSHNNKNVENKLLTCYSSQTTAHILDAMKKGNVPNVNDLTFRIYKTFVDVGSDYDTAVNFIKQPGITRIVNAYNRSNSIYSTDKGRSYILAAVREIASELNVEYEYSDTLEQIINNINMYYDDIVELNVADNVLCDIAIDTEKNIRRLNNVGEFSSTTTPVEKRDGRVITYETLRALHDLEVILQYNKIDKLAADIGEATRVCNPDKFGAKQSIFAAKDALKSIVTCINQNKTPDGTTFRLTVDGKHLLSAIYPDLDDVEDVNDALHKILNNKDFVEKSKYKPLAAFLKYATATSIAVNKHMFITQGDEFVDWIENPNDGLASVLPTGRRLTEKIATAFRNYLVNYIVTKSVFLESPMKYNVTKGKKRGFVYTTQGAPNITERNRVFGYGYSPGLRITQKYVDGKLIGTDEVFTVNNINDVKQDEIDTFNLMSPAQKIAWCKANFYDAGILEYIDVALYNGSERGTAIRGSQTLRFDEDKLDIETARFMFRQCFENSNPLLACATADIIKYAFFVEGYKLGIGNVSKIIPNNVLRNSDSIKGTDIVSNSNIEMANIQNIDAEEHSNIIERFVRANSTSIGIPMSRVYRDTRGIYELNFLHEKMIYLNGNNDEDIQLAEKYNITYKDSQGHVKANKYVQLKFGNDTILYRVHPKALSDANIHYFLIPLNKLEANENSDYSANDGNNKYDKPGYYERVINDYFSKAITEEQALDIDNDLMKEVLKAITPEERKQYKIEKIQQNDEEYVPELTGNDNFKGLIDSISQWYEGDRSKHPVLYVWNTPLSKYKTKFGNSNATVQKIRLNNGQMVTVKIVKFVHPKLVEAYIKNKTNKAKTPLYAEFSDYMDIITKQLDALQGNISPYALRDVYAITLTNLEPDNINEDEYSFSVATDDELDSVSDIRTRTKEATIQMVQGVRRRAARDDDGAPQLVKYFNQSGVVANIDAIEPRMEEVIIATANYLEKRTLDIESKLKNYIPNPKGAGFLSIDDPRTIDIIKKSPKARREYLKWLLEPRTIITDFGIMKDLDVDSEDPVLREHLTKIKKAVERMQNLSVIGNAYELYARQIFDKETNNPHIVDGFMSCLDGYFKTNKFNAWFNDIQETSNPIVQIAMRNFQRTLRSYEMEGRRRAKKFEDDIAALRREALSKGLSFDLNKGINQNGSFKADHNAKFIADRDRLQKAEIDAQREFDAIYDTVLDELTSGFESYSYDAAKIKLHSSFEEPMLKLLKAKLEYAEWKVKHVEQPLKPEYYERRNANLRKALYGSTETDDEGNTYTVKGIPNRVAEYETLNYIRRRLNKKKATDVENEELDKLLDYIDLRRNNLHNVKDAELIGDEETRDKEILERGKLKKYRDEGNAIYTEFYKREPREGFKESVAKNKSIVHAFETSSQLPSEYADNPVYVKAKRWLRRNVLEVPDWTDEEFEEYKEIQDSYVNYRYTSDKVTKHIYLKPEYRNKYGEFDITLVSPEDLKILKEKQEGDYKRHSEAAFSDKTLISNAPKDQVSYNRDWYDGLTRADGKGKKSNAEWLSLVTQINDILSEWYDERTGYVELSKIENTEENINKLKTLKELYTKLEGIRSPKDKAVSDFIKKNAEFKVNEERFEADRLYVESLSKGAFRSALNYIMYSTERKKDGTVDRVAASYLYGYMVPKKSVEDKFIDKERTRIRQLKDKLLERNIKAAYFAKKVEMYEQGLDAYKAWFHANHVYNPYEHRYEPLAGWWETRKKAEKYLDEPKWEEQTSGYRDGYMTREEAKAAYEAEEFDSIKEAMEYYDPAMDKINKNYKDGLGHEANYKYGSNPEYDSASTLNEYEQKAIDRMKQECMNLAITPEARRYFGRNWLPAESEHAPTNAKQWAKEFAKVIGYTNEKIDPNNWYDTVDYSMDKAPSMPMLEQIKGRYKDMMTKDLLVVQPKGEGQTDAEYAEYVSRIEEENKKIKEENAKVHEGLVSKDWIRSISNFIIKGSTYKAIQEGKYELWYAKDLLMKYGPYVEKYSKFGNRILKRDGSNTTEEEKIYKRTTDEELIKQFDNQLKRILYDQFKSTNNPSLLKWMSVMQSFTSAQFMMLNVKGGIANITLGETQAMGEAAARQFFGFKHASKAKLFYAGGLIDYMANAGQEKSTTLQGAIIKFFDVVDYDEHNGVSRYTKSAVERLRRIRDYGYVPQSAGEHFMQNSALFAMLESHRLFINPRADEFGQPKYTFKNFYEYTIDIRKEALKEILSPEQKEDFDKYVERITKDPNRFKEYAWLDKDFILEYLMGKCDIKQRKQFVEKEKELLIKADKEFNDDKKHPTILSNLKLSNDGILEVKKGDGPEGWLGQIDKPREDGEPSDAITLLADFKGRVISVNKYIHGVYDKSGRAQLEKTFLGSLIMQYHKHLPIGLMKRYRLKGMYSEERGVQTKGVYKSLATFVTMPFDSYLDVKDKDKYQTNDPRDHDLSKDELQALKGVQNFLRNVVDFAVHFNLYYHLLPEYDRANIRRAYGDMIGILSGMFATAAIIMAMDDDEDTLAYNLALYEADRLVSEASLYQPWTFYTESKKMLQSPIAAGSAITDLLSSANLLAHMIIDRLDGEEEYDDTFHSGKFAGEDKLKVYITRRIPIWRGIKTSFIDINTNNSYYKVGENMLGFFNIKEQAEEWANKR